MFPTICKIGSLTVYSYGMMLALAIIVCSFLLTREAKKNGINKDFIMDLIFFSVVSGIVGARLFLLR